jgi:hypothetical protein
VFSMCRIELSIEFTVKFLSYVQVTMLDSSLADN